VAVRPPTCRGDSSRHRHGNPRNLRHGVSQRRRGALRAWRQATRSRDGVRARRSATPASRRRSEPRHFIDQTAHCRTALRRRDRDGGRGSQASLAGARQHNEGTREKPGFPRVTSDRRIAPLRSGPCRDRTYDLGIKECERNDCSAVLGNGNVLQGRRLAAAASGNELRIAETNPYSHSYSRECLVARGMSRRAAHMPDGTFAEATGLNPRPPA
jgi:hypothetical protein